MLRYTLLVFLYIIMCGIALKTSVATDTAVNSLLASDKLPGLNGNLPAQQIIYIYGSNRWKMQNNVNFIEKANDYLITPGYGAHKLHIRQLPWNKARKICIEERGHLAIINSNSEEKLLMRILEENKLDEAWLGMHDLFENGDWYTVMDESLEATGYSKWTTALGDDINENNDKNQHCGVLLPSGLNNRECCHAKAFFCEINF